MLNEAGFKSAPREMRETVRILLVEDDPQFAELVQAQLRRMPSVVARLALAGTLEDALARLDAERFGLVLTDLNLPDASGLAAVEALARAGEQLVIVLTGDPNPALRAAALDSGAYDFLTKDALSAGGLERLVRLAAIQASTFRSLRESEERFRSLVALSSDWYWEQDEELRFTRFEGGAMDRFRSESFGRRRWEMGNVTPVSCTWEEHRAVLEARRPFRDFQYSRIGESGAPRFVSSSGEPVFDADGRFRGYRGIATDITARKQAEEELRRFRLALDTTPDMILLVDPATMRHVDANSTACDLIGYSREELLAMGPQDILPLSRAELERIYQGMIADPSRVTGMRSHYRCKDGSQLPFESTRRVLRVGERWIIAIISRDIRERLAAEEALRESEARFRSLAGLSSDWYWEQDAEFRLTYMSSIEKTGLDPAAYLGKQRWDEPGLNLTEADWVRHRGQLERHEPFRDFEIERPGPDGGTVWVSLSGEPVFDAAGRFAGYRGVGRDITARKRSERALRHLERINAALGEANEAVLRARSPQEVLERACQVAAAAGGFQAVTVFAYEREKDRLARRATSGDGAAPADGGPAPGEASAVLMEACRSGVPVIRGDTAAFPLRVEGEVTAVLGVRHAERDAFEEGITRLLQHLADNISFALDNLRREEARRKAKRGLRESEARFRSLTGLSSDVYWEQDEHYRFTAFSGAGSALSDEARAQRIGARRWDTHYFNMTEARWEAHRADLDARRPFHDLELGRVDASGRKVWISISGEPVFDEAGAFKGYRGVGKDISARKRAAQLRELEHSVTRSLSQADSVQDALRGAIRAVCEAEGWDCGRYFSADHAAGVLRFSGAWGVPADAVQRFLSASRNLTYASGEGISGLVWRSGEPMWVTDVSVDERSARRDLNRATGMRGAFVFPVIAEGRAIGVLGFNSRDLRQPEGDLLQAIGAIGNQIGQFVRRKQAEAVVRESEARFRSLTRLSSDWYWEQDAELRFTKFEGRGTEGHAPGAGVIGKRFWELEGLLRDSFDVEAHRERLERREAFRGLEYAYTDRAGRRFYIAVDGEPAFDADGAFAGYRGTSRDITRERRDEDDLRRFRAALDGFTDVVLLIDARTGGYVDFNETTCRVLGYAREELMGLRAADVRVDRTAEQLLADYRGLSQAAGGVNDIGVVRRKDGSTFPAEFTRRLLQTNRGPVVVAHIRDLSERQLAEQRQAAHLRYQERIARFGQSALVKREPAELVQGAVQAVLEALNAEAVAYVEREPGAGGLVLRAVVGVADSQTGVVEAAAGSALAGAIASGARRLAAGDDLPFAWARGLKSAALIPVRGEGQVRGVLCACYREADAFGAEALNFCDAAASVLSSALQRIDSEGRLAYLAQFDPLTGLPNRSLLADRFSQMIIQARRRQSRLAALFIDLDGFKQVNDTLGHAAGDALLKEVAVRLQATVRSGDTVARISGDEFAVILGDVARPEDAAGVAQKIIDRLSATVDIGGKEVFVTASVGIASFPGDGADAESLIGAADAAMYRAKQSGRNGFQFFTAEINQRTRARAQLGADLRRALDREEFSLHYQPKFDLATRTMTGAEALLRWTHPERGPVSPLEFVPVLEETGLIVPVGDWVLRRACADLKAWQAAGYAAVPVAVNLSARQFRDAALDAHLKGLIAAAGVAPDLIELEITESQLMHDPDQAIRVMRSLRDAGMRLAIDDFGTGYSSLSYLRRFPVGALKIDRSFVKDMSSEHGDATIVRTIIEMARSLGFTVVAEGVETEEQANLLRLLRCEQAQGYLLGRPAPAADLAARLSPAAPR